MQDLHSALSSIPPADRIVIIGAGIVGSSLAHILSTTTSRKIILIDRDVHGLTGSTGHAPGYVGQYNAIPALNELAKRSVQHYLTIDGGFKVVGGLEVAQTKDGLEGLQVRCEAAKESGLEAVMLQPEEVREKAKYFVKEEGVEGGLFFEKDGTANAQLIARFEQQQAKLKGAILVDAEVKSINGLTIELGVETRIEAGKVVVCAGIWTRHLLPDLPIVPVAHPYAYTAERPPRHLSTPFVRNPEAHVYVRDHGFKDGIGCYAHDPIAVAASHLGRSAYGDWETSLETVLSTALDFLPNETSREIGTDPKAVREDRVFNGLFSVTPDGMPLVGKVREGVYVASAVWVTHAFGCAKLIADVVTGEVWEGDKWLVKQLNPRRFVGKDEREMERMALGTYNDIYNKGLKH